MVFLDPKKIVKVIIYMNQYVEWDFRFKNKIYLDSVGAMHMK